MQRKASVGNPHGVSNLKHWPSVRLSHTLILLIKKTNRKNLRRASMDQGRRIRNTVDDRDLQIQMPEAPLDQLDPVTVDPVGQILMHPVGLQLAQTTRVPSSNGTRRDGPLGGHVHPVCVAEPNVRVVFREVRGRCRLARELAVREVAIIPQDRTRDMAPVVPLALLVDGNLSPI